MAHFGEGIVSERQFKETFEQLGYSQFRKGTSRSLISDTFLYTPSGWIVKTEEQAQHSLECLKFLIKIGVLYPGTAVGIRHLDTATESGQYALFAITRNLISCSSREQVPKSWEKFLDPPGANWQEDMLAQPGHLTDWIQKVIDSGKSNHPLLALLDFVAEATHRKNWAWDPNNGKLNPIDMGVINFNSDRQQQLIEDWFAKQRHAESNL